MATIAYDLLSLFTAFIIYGNGGITYINGLIVEEFLQDYQAGEAVTTWVASAQISLCLISGEYEYPSVLKTNFQSEKAIIMQNKHDGGIINSEHKYDAF